MKPSRAAVLGLDRDRVLEIAEHHVDLAGELADLGAHLLVMRRHEMDHALEPRGQLGERARRADRQRLEKFARSFQPGHSYERRPPMPAIAWR